MTHDLFAEVIDGLGAALERVVVTELRNSTFYAELYLRDGNGGVQTISARPSDAIALAARTGSPIFAEEALIEEAGIEEDETEDSPGDEEEMVQELRKFLEDVNPEDFLPE
jgi:bifunctional DNase/RNase